MSILLFTYGILKNEGEMVAQDVHINANMYDLGSYPAITSLDSFSIAVGNVIRITQDELDLFDRIEGVDLEKPENGLYRRVKMYLNAVNAWVYIYLYNGKVFERERVKVWDRAYNRKIYC